MNKKLITLSVAVLFLNGCATYVKVRLLKPSEFNVGSIRKIAVNDFKFNGNYYYNEETSVESIAANAVLSAITGNKYNPYQNTIPGYEVTQAFTQKLFENGHFKVVEKNNSFQTLDSDTSKEQLNRIRNTTDAEGVILGNGNYSVTDSGQWVDDVTYKNGVKITNKKYRINRRVETSLVYRFINTLNGEVLATKNNSTSYTESETGVDQDTAKNNLNDWRNTVREQVRYLSDESVRQIAPYYVTEDREIKEGKSYLMKSALESVKKDMWESAKTNWESLLQNKASISQEFKEDIVFATYNLGVYNEINGNFNKAQELFTDCYTSSRKSECLNAKSRVEKRKFEVERLKSQNRTDIKN